MSDEVCTIVGDVTVNVHTLDALLSQVPERGLMEIPSACVSEMCNLDKRIRDFLFDNSVPEFKVE